MFTCMYVMSQVVDHTTTQTLVARMRSIEHALERATTATAKRLLEHALPKTKMPSTASPKQNDSARFGP